VNLGLIGQRFPYRWNVSRGGHDSCPLRGVGRRVRSRCRCSLRGWSVWSSHAVLDERELLPPVIKTMVLAAVAILNIVLMVGVYM
jgi:hypothetical protein